MRSSRFATSLSTIALGVSLGALIAACGSAEAPGWTYQPAPSATPVASVPASGPPSPGSTPTLLPSASGPAGGPAGSPGAGETVTVVAENALAFQPDRLTVAADTAFTLEFDNRDASAPHNIVIEDPAGGLVDIGDTSFFTGPQVRTYQVPPLAAADYRYICQVHPTTMIGTLTAG